MNPYMLDSRKLLKRKRKN